MSDANKRALRTLFHGLIALLTFVPLVLAALPADSPIAAKATGIVGAIAAVSAVMNRLEDAGLIPAWLKDSDPSV